MKIQEVIKALRTNSAKVVGKEVGICDKRLLRGLKNAGYEYSKKSGVGWRFTGQGEAPLHQNIKDFITDTNNAPKRVSNVDINSSFTTNEMKDLRKMMEWWGSVNGKDDAISKRKECAVQSDDSSKNVEPLYSLYIRTKELASKDKVRRTMNLDKELCARVDSFENQYSLNRDDIVEAALRVFFEKYSDEYKA
ncbi:hypothetical protein [Bacillus gaemokensis]|uniref:CopG family transcriptional regulator n=1 Tax=Bacillus gaemokensis TaxID=574375 RepID=A0A073KF09_9BACI|nr:hypothetical protein [Bacillus gaemokensis]KEK25165.1 hypothetical protein BAGA_11025 [Bacillus gaemokensis]KYG37392.1 hypothetical protein AZF08_08280 [Bacillus gaemokensis]